MDRLTETYAFLGHYKERLGNKSTSILQLFVPIVEKAIYMHMQENDLQVIQGMAMSEIRERIKSVSGLEIPVPVITSILHELEGEINDESLFKIYSDNAFSIKFQSLTDREPLMKESEKELSILELHFGNYCKLHGVDVDFSELVRFVSSSQLGMFTAEIGNIEDFHFIIAKYIESVRKNKEIYSIIAELYLGGLISNYLGLQYKAFATKTELLIDTNFYISLVDLNTEDAHTTCMELYKYCTRMGYSFSILPTTVAQIKILLGNRIREFALRDFIGTVRTADVYAACIRRKLDQTELERIRDKVDETLTNMNITVLKEAQIRSIVDAAKKGESYKLLKSRRRNSDSALNDAIAVEYVRTKRGKDVSDFASVKCWFLHNSYSAIYAEPNKSMAKKTSISASELLTLLWLSNPSQLPKSDELARVGLSNYIAKFLEGKQPAIEVIKQIKTRADKAVTIGAVTPKDVFVICTRMAEGSLTIDEMDNLSNVTDVEFSIFAAECEAAHNELVEKAQKAIQKDRKFQKVKTRLKELDKQIPECNSSITNLETKILYLEREWSKSFVDGPKWILFGIGGLSFLLLLVDVILKNFGYTCESRWLSLACSLFPMGVGVAAMGWGLQMHHIEDKRKEKAFLKWGKREILETAKQELSGQQEVLKGLMEEREQLINSL